MICKFSLQKNSVFYSLIILKQTPEDVTSQGVSAPGQSRLAGVWKNPPPSFSLQTKSMTVIQHEQLATLFGRLPKWTRVRLSETSANSRIYIPLKINGHWVSKFLSKDVCLFRAVSCLTVMTVPSTSHPCPLAKQRGTNIRIGSSHGTEHHEFKLSTKWPLEPEFHDFHVPQSTVKINISERKHKV